MRCVTLIIALLITPIALMGGATPLPYLYANHPESGVGMFAVFSYVAGVLYRYDIEPDRYAGLEVNFEKRGFYYEPTYGSNWWEYYCEPICLGSKKGANVEQFDIYKFADYALFQQFHLDRQQVNHLIEKYIKVKEEIQRKVEQFYEEQLLGYHVVGVHYRGTDKIAEAPRVSFDQVLASIHQYISENAIHNYRIFVASDELQFVQFMQQKFPDAVTVYSTQHSDNGKALHCKLSHPRLHGEEALIDCLLLSRGNVLIRTSSNLSLWSTYFNPEIPVIELSQRNPSFYLYPNTQPWK